MINFINKSVDKDLSRNILILHFEIFFLSIHPHPNPIAMWSTIKTILNKRNNYWKLLLFSVKFF